MMNESIILDALESIVNGISTIAALALATFMINVAILIYIMANYYKK